MQPQELGPEEFVSERFLPIFEHVFAEAGLPFDQSHFFSAWRQVMDMGLARTWALDGAVLGALFTKDLFNGKLRTAVVFWFSLPQVRGTPITRQLFESFESAAIAAGAVDIQSAAHEKLNPEKRAFGYWKHGFDKSETIFVKKL